MEKRILRRALGIRAECNVCVTDIRLRQRIESAQREKHVCINI